MFPVLSLLAPGRCLYIRIAQHTDASALGLGGRFVVLLERNVFIDRTAQARSASLRLHHGAEVLAQEARCLQERGGWPCGNSTRGLPSATCSCWPTSRQQLTSHSPPSPLCLQVHGQCG